MDRALTKDIRGVVLLVLDGLGSAHLEEFLGEGSFLRRHKVRDLSAVFPPTTVAATPSLRSGLFPGEHGWLGWTMYFPALNENVDVFGNTQQFSRTPAWEQHAAQTLLPYPQLAGRLVKEGKANAAAVSAHDEVYARTFEDLVAQVTRLLARQGKQYVYAYYHQPDSAMHTYGVRSREAREAVLALDRQVEGLARSLPPDCLLAVTADHGLVDAVPLALEDYPEIQNMLARPIFLEPRAAAFAIKEEYRPDFPRAFKAAFEGEFLLLSREELLASGLLGPGEYREDLSGYVGDFIALAISDKALYMKKEHCRIVGMHAGLTGQEFRVPLIIWRG